MRFGYNLNYMSLKLCCSESSPTVGFGYNLNYMSLKLSHDPEVIILSFGYNLNYMSLKRLMRKANRS